MNWKEQYKLATGCDWYNSLEKYAKWLERKLSEQNAQPEEHSQIKLSCVAKCRTSGELEEVRAT
jgi:hypothetical protein